jgi:YceI-like protein
VIGVSRFRIDPERSQVWIDARSSLHPIRSETSGLAGWLEAEIGRDGRLDPSVDPRAHLDLEIDLLSTGNAFYDREMRRRVDARRFPHIAGELTAMKESGHGEYRVSGDVTFRGRTLPYTDDMTLAVSDEGPWMLRLEGTHQFDIRDFGVEPPRVLGLRVHPEVTVRVVVVAREVEPASGELRAPAVEDDAVSAEDDAVSAEDDAVSAEGAA